MCSFTKAPLFKTSKLSRRTIPNVYYNGIETDLAYYVLCVQYDVQTIHNSKYRVVNVLRCRFGFQTISNICTIIIILFFFLLTFSFSTALHFNSQLMFKIPKYKLCYCHGVRSYSMRHFKSISYIRCKILSHFYFLIR